MSGKTVGAILGLACLLVAAEAGAAILSRLQSGTTTSTVNGTTTVTIAAVDTTKSFLVFNVRSDSNRPPESVVMGRLASSTTIEFLRNTDAVSPVTITIQWYVASFSTGVTVQHGTFVQSSTTQDVTITAVGSLSQAFALWSKTTNAGSGIYDYNDPAVMQLTSTTNLQMRTDGVYNDATFAWQVVEYTDAADILVQRGTITSMTGTTSSVTATLGTAVDIDRTFLLTSHKTLSRSTSAGVGVASLRARLSNATTVTIDRAVSDTPDVTVDAAWTTGLTHTVGTGSNRLLMFAVGYENSSDVGVSAVSYGGQSLTKITGVVVGTADRVELWYLNENQIASASGSTFTITWGGTAPTDPMYAAATFANVYQPTPIAGSSTNSSNTATPNPITASRAVSAHGMSVSAVICGSNGSYTWGNSFTEGTDQTSGTTTNLSTANLLAAADGTATASATHTGPNKQAIAIAALNPAWPDVDEIAWEAVELLDGSTVERGTASLGSGTTQSVVSLSSPTDTSRAIAFTGVQSIGGQGMGRSSYTTDDVLGTALATLGLSGSTLTIERGNSLGTADFGWFVLQLKRRRMMIVE